MRGDHARPAAMVRRHLRREGVDTLTTHDGPGRYSNAIAFESDALTLALNPIVGLKRNNAPKCSRRPQGIRSACSATELRRCAHLAVRIMRRANIETRRMP
jgi:hypothetical protein